MEEINPTKGEINEFFRRLIKREFGEEIVFYDADNYSEEEIIENMKKDGWTFGGYFQSLEIGPLKDKKIKIIGLGKKLLLFYKQDNG